MKKGIQLLGLLLAGALTITGCDKVKDNVDPNVFNGTWVGTMTCVGMDPVDATTTITMSGSKATADGVSGFGACAKPTTYNGNIFNDHLVFSGQFVDNCGNSNGYTATVYVYKNTMTLSQTLTGVQLNTTCKFVGGKQ